VKQDSGISGRTLPQIVFKIIIIDIEEILIVKQIFNYIKIGFKEES
jgi:hypothetical protein